MRISVSGVVATVVLLAGSHGAFAQTENTYRAENEIRMMEMENQLRRVTGQYEEAMYRLTQVNRRLERSLEDMEYRLGVLEQQQRGPASAGGAVAPIDDTGVMVAENGVSAGVEGVVAGGETSAAEVSTTAEAAVVGSAVEATPESAPEQFLEGDTPEQQFQAAFAHLRRNELQEAEYAFRAFLTLYPDESLASNSKYWLGKTYYARGDYGAAARVFLEGFEQFSSTDKGPDTLLHLALSLNQLGQQEDACAAFDELSSLYPEAGDAVGQRAQAGRRAAGCS